MKISNVHTLIAGNPWKNWLLTLVETDEGITGIGEGTLNAFARTVEAAVHELRPMYIGQDPFQPALIVQRMTRDVYSDGGQIHRSAVAAIEIACWDIMGKALGRPIADLLGGRCHSRLRAYANGWYRGPRTPDSFATRAKEVVARGYTALKEEPVHHKDLLGLIEVGRGSPVPIATGESLTSLEEVATALHGGGVGILQPEPLNIGGLLAAREACAMAEAHGIVAAPHQAQGPVCTAACVQLSAACPNFYLQEIFDEFNVDWEQRIATPPTHVVEGFIEVPTRPGLGISLDLEEIGKHPYQPSAYLPLFRSGWELRETSGA